MRWPFVLRSTHDALMAAKQDALELEAAHRVHAQRRYDDLIARHEQFVALVADRTAPAAKPEPPKPDPVQTAIARRAGRNGALRAHLSDFAASSRASGVSDSEIVRRVTDWFAEPVDDGVSGKTRDRAEAESVVADLLDREDGA